MGLSWIYKVRRTGHLTFKPQQEPSGLVLQGHVTPPSVVTARASGQDLCGSHTS